MAVSALAAVASSAAASAGAALAWSVAATAAISTTTFAIIAAVGTAVVMAGVSAVMKNMTKAKTSTPEAKDRKQMIRSPVAARTIVYGEARVSGPIVFAGSTGDKNKYLHLVIVLAGHEIEAIDEVWFNDDKLTFDADGVTVISEPYGSITYTDETEYDSEWGGNRPRVNSVPGSTAAGARSTALTIPAGYRLDSVQAVVLTYKRYAWDENVYTVSITPSVNGTTVSYTVPSTYNWTSCTINYTLEKINVTSRARVKKYLGSAGQTADPDLLSECGALGWTSDHRLRGLPYLYVRLEYDADAYPSGLPNISAVVRGKKVYDPRTLTTAYSNNWALCVRDYLTSVNGLGCTAAEIDDTALIAAANVADQYFAWAIPKRYRLNGVISTEQRPIDALQEMVAAGAGDLVWSGGVYKLYAGADRASTASLTVTDLRGPIKVQAKKSRAELMNGIRATFINPDAGWLEGEITPYLVQDWVAQDGDEEVYGDLKLNFTNNRQAARHLAVIALKRSRQGIVVEMPLNLRGFKLAVGDVVDVTLAQMGWAAKEFRVERWKLADNGLGVDVVLHEFSGADYSYDINLADTSDTAPDTSLIKPWQIGAPSNATAAESLYRTVADHIKTRVTLNWTAPSLGTAVRYTVGYKNNAAAKYTTFDTTYPGAVIDDITAPGFFQYYVQAHNPFGVKSKPAWSPGYNLLGKTEPPAQPDFLRIEITANGARRFDFGLTDAPIDLAGYEIRYNAGSSAAAWDAQTTLHSGILKRAPIEIMGFLDGTYTFTVRALDTSGNYSSGRSLTSTFTPPSSAVILATEDARSNAWL